MVNLEKYTGFQWDSANAYKNWDKHQVSQTECEQIFFNQPLLLYDDAPHSQIEPRYYILGQTNAARRLFVAFTIRQDLVRVISARDMSKLERKIYEEA